MINTEAEDFLKRWIGHKSPDNKGVAIYLEPTDKFYSIQEERDISLKSISFHICVGTIFYFIWVRIFIKKRKELDYRQYVDRTKEQGGIVEIVNAIRDIKLNNFERYQATKWDEIQTQMSKNGIKSLTLIQNQTVGGTAIIEITSVLILLISATETVGGSISLGGLFSIQYIMASSQDMSVRSWTP